MSRCHINGPRFHTESQTSPNIQRGAGTWWFANSSWHLQSPPSVAAPSVQKCNPLSPPSASALDQSPMEQRKLPMNGAGRVKRASCSAEDPADLCLPRGDVQCTTVRFQHQTKVNCASSSRTGLEGRRTGLEVGSAVRKGLQLQLEA